MTHLDDLADHPVALVAAAESAPDTTSDYSWLRYARRAGDALGRDLSLCAEAEDGCSLDSACDAWSRGVSVAAYAAGDRSASPWLRPVAA